MNRRRFLQSTAAGTISPANFPHHFFAAAKPKNATDRVRLGARKIPISRMAMGTGTIGSNRSSNQTRKLGYHAVAELFRREALKTVPRDKVTIISKTQTTTAARMKADLDRFRRELGGDYIDILLLHVQTAPDWNIRQRPVMDVISEAREKGSVRTHRVSSRTLGALKTAAAEPWVEVDLARLNPAGRYMDAEPKVVKIPAASVRG